MSIFEYDAEKELRLLREDAIASGLQEGREQGIKQGIEYMG